MRIARFEHDGRIRYGTVTAGEFGQQLVTPISTADLFGDWEPAGSPIPLAAVRLLAPVVPSKIIGIGSNYRAWDGEERLTLPNPFIFFKPPSAIINPGDTVIIPEIAEAALHETELAVVIGTECRDVPEARALDVVFGYTCANDVTAVNLPASAGSDLTRTKAFDTFCPLGPWIETQLDPRDLALRCYVGDEQRQDGRTSWMVRTVAEIIAYVSHAMTLLPGDLILTGTPRDYGRVEAGKTVTVAIEGIGRLENPVEWATALRPSIAS